MKKNTFYIIGLVAAVLVSSCGNSRTARIEGTITEGAGELLVLEHLTDGMPRLVDTLRLDEAGKFCFEPEVEEGPDFFSLRLNGQSISLVIDTLQSPVCVTASAKKLANGYEVADDLNQELQSAVQLGNRLRRQVIDVAKAVNEGRLSSAVGSDSVFALAQAYKERVMTDYIYQNPASPTSYYVLFETVNGMPIFDSNEPRDNRVFGAVATSWQFAYPNSPRNKVLEQKTLEGQRLRHRQAALAARQDSILNSVVVESKFPVLDLPNADDQKVPLTSMVDGQSVVLVDFTAYYLPSSPAHNLILNSLYEKYDGVGLKIYQVCLDFDENFWKTSADNLPWTAVRDEETVYQQDGTIQYSPAAMLYNVKQLPTTYIIKTDGELVCRVEDDAKLEAELKKIFK